MKHRRRSQRAHCMCIVHTLYTHYQCHISFPATHSPREKLSVWICHIELFPEKVNAASNNGSPHSSDVNNLVVEAFIDVIRIAHVLTYALRVYVLSALRSTSFSIAALLCLIAPYGDGIGRVCVCVICKPFRVVVFRFSFRFIFSGSLSKARYQSCFSQNEFMVVKWQAPPSLWCSHRGCFSDPDGASSISFSNWNKSKIKSCNLYTGRRQWWRSGYASFVSTFNTMKNNYCFLWFFFPLRSVVVAQFVILDQTRYEQPRPGVDTFETIFFFSSGRDVER